MRQNGLDLRAKDQRFIDHGVVERVNAELVTNQKQLALPPVIKGEGELPVEAVQEVDAVSFVKVNQDLDIRVGAKAMPLCQQLAAEFTIVVNLAVADERD